MTGKKMITMMAVSDVAADQPQLHDVHQHQHQQHVAPSALEHVPHSNREESLEGHVTTLTNQVATLELDVVNQKQMIEKLKDMTLGQFDQYGMLTIHAVATSCKYIQAVQNTITSLVPAFDWLYSGQLNDVQDRCLTRILKQTIRAYHLLTPETKKQYGIN